MLKLKITMFGLALAGLAAMASGSAALAQDKAPSESPCRPNPPRDGSMTATIW